MAQIKIQSCARTSSSWRLSRCRPGTLRRLGHPSGVMAVGAEAELRDGSWVVTKAIMSRSARRLMEGSVFVASSLDFERSA
jgi:2-methylaconitate cis-trans-isomerase PrpF